MQERMNGTGNFEFDWNATPVRQEQNKYSVECTDAMHCVFYLPLTLVLTHESEAR